MHGSTCIFRADLTPFSLKLCRWLCNQRRYKRKLDRGDPTQGMTVERAAKMDVLGFEWELAEPGNRDDAGWDAQLAKLEAYTRRHGDCNVPQAWAEDPKLGRWVNTQRMYKKKLDRGEPSQGMTAARAGRLEALGFAWETLDGAWEAQLARLAV